MTEEGKGQISDSLPLFVFVGIGLLSAGAIGSEIALSRTLAVAQSYHFAFLIISIALLGYGAAGTLLAFRPPATPSSLSVRLVSGALGFALSLPVAMVILQRLPFDPFRLAWDPLQWVVVLVYYLLLGIPFGMVGFTIGSALQTFATKAPAIYGADLAGAALGALAAVVAFHGRPVEAVLGSAVVLGAASALVLSLLLGWRWRLASLASILLLLSATFSRPASFFGLPMSPYKPFQVSLQFRGARLLETRWSPRGRIDRFISPATRYAPGLSLNYRLPLPPQEGLTLDGARQSSITLASPHDPSSAFLEALSSSVAYALVEPRRVLVLGAGGGLEILAAWRAGARRVEAVVADESVIEILRRAEGSGPAFRQTALHAGNDRLVLESSPGSFDVIQLALTEQPGPGSTGLYHLTEAYLYTVESFEAMLRSLAPGGLIAVTRYLLPPPRTELRLVSLARQALARQGVLRISSHLAAIRSLNTFTLLISKDALTAQQLSALRGFCKQWGFDLVYYPGMGEEEANLVHRFPEPLYFRLLSNLIDEKSFRSAMAEYPFDLSPTTDDRPFFFNTLRWRYIGTVYRAAKRKWTAIIEGGYLVPLILLQALLASLVLVVLAWAGARKSGQARSGSRPAVVLYFSALGLGFMGVEIAGLEQAILLLGNPTYAMAAVLSSLLCFAGLGSWLGGRLRVRVPWICLLVGLLALVNGKLFAFALAQSWGWPLVVRYGWVVALMAPVGILMGMPFPLGLRRLSEAKGLVPLAWCANGVCSVVGSVGALNLALSAGFSGVWWASAVAYLAACLASRGLPAGSS
jgi:spermidine synthase